MRFSEFNKARSFVADEHIEEFNERAKSLKNAHFTDFESEPIELDDSLRKATVRVTYTIYTAAVPYEVEVDEVQEWTREGVSNAWRVSSTFEGLRELALN